MAQRGSKLYAAIERQNARQLASYMRQQQAKPRSQSVLVADVGDSECFDDLRYSGGEVFATFAKDGSQYSYPMSKSDAREWFADDLGKYFNDNVR